MESAAYGEQQTSAATATAAAASSATSAAILARNGSGGISSNNSGVRPWRTGERDRSSSGTPTRTGGRGAVRGPSGSRNDEEDGAARRRTTRQRQAASARWRRRGGAGKGGGGVVGSGDLLDPDWEEQRRGGEWGIEGSGEGVVQIF